MAASATRCGFFPAAVVAGALVSGCAAPGDESEADVRYSRNRVELYAGLEHDAPVLSVLGFDSELTVLDTHRSFVRVRTESGLLGWVPGAMLLDGALRRELELLTRRSAALPSQGSARARDTLNVHTEPYRWAPTFYQLAKDEGFQILDRMLVDRLPAAAAESRASFQPTGEDYWYLVRIPDVGASGWLLANMVYPDIPIDVAALAAGRSIVAHFRIEVGAGEGAAQGVPVWIWFQSSGPGQVHDFDRLTVLRRDTRRDRYIVIRQTSNLSGYLPVDLLPEFQADRGVGTGIHVLVEQGGQLYRRTYAQVGTRSLYLGQERASALPHLIPPGGFGRRYDRSQLAGY